MEHPNKRLAQAFRQLSAQLEELSQRLQVVSDRMGWIAYRHFNQPFGDGDMACRIWVRFRQYTTRN
ncbi:hypothetical protein [Rhodothermus bifroesti]|uniref:Uncharacterized protein n=1 Tax=Rhodothermus marinus TaxID=29549 RepID=A0A7V2AYN8_RHOMR|nr:hypothetical protein [Rhodothermus bifroesti]GBD02417.1 hypothetical protein HRbin18_02158 [bacterium HR18]